MIACALLLFGCSKDHGMAGNPVSPEELMGYVESSRYSKDLSAISIPRPAGSENWKTVQDLCASRLNELGYEVELHTYGTGVNVIGRLKGSESPERMVILSAHYDSSANCPGADDNGSGVAGVLEAARVLAKTTYRHTLIVALWDEEETGKFGSKAYASRAKSRGDDIIIALIYEMIGYRSQEPNSQELPAATAQLFPQQYAEIEANHFRGDFIGLVFDEHAQSGMDTFGEFAASISLRYVEMPIKDESLNNPLLSEFSRSDHVSFWISGYPAVMISDTANYRYSSYHCAAGAPPDDGSRLDADFSRDVIKATVGTVAQLLEIK